MPPGTGATAGFPASPCKNLLFFDVFRATL